MKTVIIVIIFLHGLIHIMGFLKAFGLKNIDQLKTPIGKVSGVFWLFMVLVFLAAGFLLIMNNDIWKICTIAGVVISQLLIISAWQDAKFGTAANIVILFITITGFGITSG